MFESVMPSNHHILCRPLLLLLSVFPPASGSFPKSQFFTLGGQSIGVSVSTSVLAMNIQDLFPLGLTGLVSLQPRDSQESSPTPQFKGFNYSVPSFLYLTPVHDYWKKHNFDYTDLYLILLMSNFLLEK